MGQYISWLGIVTVKASVSEQCFKTQLTESFRAWPAFVLLFHSGCEDSAKILKGRGEKKGMTLTSKIHFQVVNQMSKNNTLQAIHGQHRWSPTVLLSIGKKEPSLPTGTELKLQYKCVCSKPASLWVKGLRNFKWPLKKIEPQQGRYLPGHMKKHKKNRKEYIYKGHTDWFWMTTFTLSFLPCAIRLL